MQWGSRWVCYSVAALVASPAFVVAPAIKAQVQEREEIVVTTRRREENLQEVPLAVTAITEQQIQDRGIRNIRGVVQLDPSVIIDEGFTAEDTRIAIRGLSNTRGRSNVAFLVDGVDVTSEAIGVSGSSLLVNQRLLADVERIEVVKGPQSALYGRAAFAGAISYVTKNANMEELDSNVGLEVSDYNRYQLNGGVSGPVIADKLAMGLQGAVWDGDSFYDNAASGENFGGSNGWGAAFTTNWEPSDTFALKWRVSHSDDETGAAATFVYRDPYIVELPIPEQALESNGGPIGDDEQIFAPPTLGSADGRQAFASENPITGGEFLGTSLKVSRTSLNINWDIGPGTFTSTTGFTSAESVVNVDVDFQAVGRPDQIPNNFVADDKTDTRQLSQEFRYATAFDGPFNFTGGLLGWRQTRDYLDKGYIVTCMNNADPLCTPGNWQAVIRASNLEYGDNGFKDAETQHWSVYGLVEWQPIDALNVALEARYVDETFELSRTTGTLCLIANSQNPCSPAESATLSGKTDSSFTTPKLTVEYQFSDQVMAYASAGKGQKPAGISTFPGGSGPTIEEFKFDSEEMWAYEAGWKTSFGGGYGEVVFNGAVFFQDYTDKQVPVSKFDPVLGLVSSIENASSAEVFGQELQLLYLPPVEGLSVNLAYTHLDAEYNDYVSSTRSARDVAETSSCEVVQVPDDPNDPTSSRTECLVDRTGNSLEKSPEHAFFGTISLNRPLFDTGWSYLAEIDGNYQGERFTTANNFAQLDDIWLANLRLGLQTDTWSIIGFVDNLFDNDTITSGGSTPPDFGAGFAIPPVILTTTQLPNPRVYGVRVNWRLQP